MNTTTPWFTSPIIRARARRAMPERCASRECASGPCLTFLSPSSTLNTPTASTCCACAARAVPWPPSHAGAGRHTSRSPHPPSSRATGWCCHGNQVLSAGIAAGAKGCAGTREPYRNTGRRRRGRARLRRQHADPRRRRCHRLGLPVAQQPVDSRVVLERLEGGDLRWRWPEAGARQEMAGTVESGAGGTNLTRQDRRCGDGYQHRAAQHRAASQQRGHGHVRPPCLTCARSLALGRRLPAGLNAHGAVDHQPAESFALFRR